MQFDSANAGMLIAAFLETDKSKELSGPTGGVQSMKGTLFGIPYLAESWQDKLLESFSGTHDFMGGKSSALYDEQGYATQGRSDAIKVAQKIWSGAAIVRSAPFAMAELLSLQAWQVFPLMLRATR